MLHAIQLLKMQYCKVKQVEQIHILIITGTFPGGTLSLYHGMCTDAPVVFCRHIVQFLPTTTAYLS